MILSSLSLSLSLSLPPCSLSKQIHKWEERKSLWSLSSLLTNKYFIWLFYIYISRARQLLTHIQDMRADGPNNVHHKIMYQSSLVRLKASRCENTQRRTDLLQIMQVVCTLYKVSKHFNIFLFIASHIVIGISNNVIAYRMFSSYRTALLELVRY